MRDEKREMGGERCEGESTKFAGESSCGTIAHEPSIDPPEEGNEEGEGEGEGEGLYEEEVG